jgi:signal transduction histidine kinase
LKPIYIIYFLIIFFFKSFSQEIVFVKNDSTNIELSDKILVFQDTSKKLKIDSILNQKFTPYIKNVFSKIKSSDVFWVKFALSNKSTHSVSLNLNVQKQFFLDLYQIKSHQQTRHIAKGGFSNTLMGQYIYEMPFILAPNDTNTFYLRVVFDTFHLQNVPFSMKLCTNYMAKYHQKEFVYDHLWSFIVYFFAVCFLIFGIYLGLIHYYDQKDFTIIYYLFVLIITILVILRVAEFNLGQVILPRNNPYFLTFWLIIDIPLGLFYILFFSKFFQIKSKHPHIERLAILANYIYGALYLLSFLCVLYILTNRIVLKDTFEVMGIISVFLTIYPAYIVYLLYKTTNDFKINVIYGFGFLVLGNFISVIISRIRATYVLSVWQTPSTYLCLGIIFELLFFIVALSKLNQFLQKAAMATGQMNERKRVSADLHDEIGSALSTIAILSDISKSKAQKLAPDLVNGIEKIGEKSREMILTMRDTIWSMNDNNTQNIWERMHQFASEFLTTKKIKLDWQIPLDKSIEQIEFTKKKNLLMAFKEALHNIVKHAAAKNVIIRSEIQLDKISLQIIDDGKGFDVQSVENQGNGLKNFTKRMEEIDGNFTIKSELNKGTELTFIFSYP